MVTHQTRVCDSADSLREMWKIQSRKGKHEIVLRTLFGKLRWPGATPRHPCMKLEKNFGGCYHGTVLHACKTVSARMKNEDQFRQTIAGLDTKLDR